MFTLESDLLEVAIAGAEYEGKVGLSHGQSAKQKISFLQRHWFSKFPEIKTVREYMQLGSKDSYNGDKPHRVETLTRLLSMGFCSQQ